MCNGLRTFHLTELMQDSRLCNFHFNWTDTRGKLPLPTFKTVVINVHFFYIHDYGLWRHSLNMFFCLKKHQMSLGYQLFPSSCAEEMPLNTFSVSAFVYRPGGRSAGHLSWRVRTFTPHIHSFHFALICAPLTSHLWRCSSGHVHTEAHKSHATKTSLSPLTFT